MKGLFFSVIFKHAEYVTQLPLLKPEIDIEPEEETVIAKLNHVARFAVELRGHAIHLQELQLARAENFRALSVQIAQPLSQHLALIGQALLDEIVRAAFQRG